MIQRKRKALFILRDIFCWRHNSRRHQTKLNTTHQLQEFENSRSHFQITRIESDNRRRSRCVNVNRHLRRRHFSLTSSLFDENTINKAEQSTSISIQVMSSSVQSTLPRDSISKRESPNENSFRSIGRVVRFVVIPCLQNDTVSCMQHAQDCCCGKVTHQGHPYSLVRIDDVSQ